jgi:hypothetical protein
MLRPESYGVFHIVCCVITLAGAFFLCRLHKKPSEKFVRGLLLITSITVMLLEVYKQLAFTFDVQDGELVKDYLWYAFPFQFCSTPMYVCLLAGLIKQDKIHRALCAYLATFSTFAGLCVMFYPGDVFIRTIGINIQTMIHHGLQVVLGVFYTVHYFGTRDRSKRRLFHIGAIGVFAVMVLVALLLNLTVHNALVSAGNDETFNMYFISPYHECTLPVLSLIDDRLPYPVFLMIYITGFAAAASIVYYAVLEIYNLIGKRRKANAA